MRGWRAMGAVLLLAGVASGAGVAREAVTEYMVVINHEEQYSIWPKQWKVASGWKPTGAGGSLERCHAYIEEVWTDMRPLSVRDWQGKEYMVVINHEEQYSVWPAGKKPPRGWKATGVEGSQAECQEHIEEVWTDMRPLSVRRKLGEE